MYEAEIVGHSQFIHKILHRVAVQLPGEGCRNPGDSHYSLPLRMIMVLFWLSYPTIKKRIWSAKGSILCGGEAGVNQAETV